MVGVVVVFVTETSGQCTVIVTGPETLLPGVSSKVARTRAVLESVPGQFATVTGAWTETCRVVVGAIVPKLHVRAPPARTQTRASSPVRDQSNPAGSVSSRTTLVALPGPALLTVIV